MSARVLVISFAVIAAAAASAAAQQSLMPPLAEIARQAEAAQPTKAKAKKSYTNADLHATETPAANIPDGYVSATTGKVVTPEEMVKASEEKVDATNGHNMPEEHWRQRADFIRSQVVKANAELTRLRIPVAGRSEILEARNANEIKKNQQMLDGVMKQWSLLEESRRVARVPADWIGTIPAQQ